MQIHKQNSAIPSLNFSIIEVVNVWRSTEKFDICDNKLPQTQQEATLKWIYICRSQILINCLILNQKWTETNKTWKINAMEKRGSSN